MKTDFQARGELIVEALQLEGWGIEHQSYDKEGGCIYARNTAVEMRTRLSGFEFGDRNTFDRWANSCDFVLHSFPRDLLSARAVLRAAVMACEKVGGSTRWGEELEINCYYRECRRQLKGEADED